MGIHELSITPVTTNFVHKFSFMKKLMATDSIESCEETPKESKKVKLRPGFWLQRKNKPIWFIVIAKKNKLPNPK
jgi:hypothetical protein